MYEQHDSLPCLFINLAHYSVSLARAIHLIQQYGNPILYALDIHFIKMETEAQIVNLTEI